MTLPDDIYLCLKEVCSWSYIMMTNTFTHGPSVVAESVSSMQGDLAVHACVWRAEKEGNGGDDSPPPETF